MLKQIDEEQKNRLEMEHFLKKKEESVNNLNNLIDKIKPILGSTLIELSKSKFNDDKNKNHDYELNMNINDRNIEEYLSDLEKFINLLIMIRQETKIKGVNGVKENSTSYSKPLPALNLDEISR
jgi:hypothetical protein